MKARQIPMNAVTREYPKAAVVAYCYQSTRGPAYSAFKGRQSKPAEKMAFNNVEARDRYLAQYVARETEREEAKRARTQAEHGLAVGDIVVSLWGHEQTNATFFEVVRVPSLRSVAIRQIESTYTEDAPQAHTGRRVPSPGVFVPRAEEYTRRATSLHSVSPAKNWHGDMRKWNGKPVCVTTYG